MQLQIVITHTKYFSSELQENVVEKETYTSNSFSSYQIKMTNDASKNSINYIRKRKSKKK